MKLVLAWVAVVGGIAVGATAAETPPRPNFLFIYTDDQRYDAMSVVQQEQGNKARFPWLKTPNLDRIAQEGVRFRNAFVVNSLCAPSRATFLTGCYGHLNGVVNNHTPFPEDNVTHASLLRKAGYKTGYIGKWHMGSQRGQRPGFDFSASFIGQGKYFDCPVEVNGESRPTQGWIDDVSTDYAQKFIQEHQQQPFLLVLGYKTCHGPFEPPPRHAQDYSGEQARAVPNLGTPAIYRGSGGPKKVNDAPPAGDTVVKTNLGMFRGITAIDENVGKLLKLLDTLKLTDNTVVVFASDNGYYLGEHGLGDKRSAYEESLRIPLLVRYPKLAAKGQVVDQMALNIDLSPTFLDLAGVPVPDAMQGRSWRPLLEGRAPNDWRKAWFYCYFLERNFSVPMVTAVRTDTAKLIKYPGHDDWTEVFDLKNDPYELKNLANDTATANLRKELEAEYERQKQAIRFEVPKHADTPADPATPAPAAPAKAANAWVLDYRFDKDAREKVNDASGKGNHGTAHGTAIVEGRDGHKARKFDGTGYIDVPKSPSLDPSVGALRVEVTAKADKPNGIVLARGGASHGYCLYLSDGRPVWTVVAANQATTIRGEQAVTGDWASLTGKITADQRLVLLVNGKEVASGKLPKFIPIDPNNALQIGADEGSQVVELEKGAKGKQLSQFVGLIESVRIYSGEEK